NLHLPNSYSCSRQLFQKSLGSLSHRQSQQSNPYVRFDNPLHSLNQDIRSTLRYLIQHLRQGSFSIGLAMLVQSPHGLRQYCKKSSLLEAHPNPIHQDLLLNTLSCIRIVVLKISFFVFWENGRWNKTHCWFLFTLGYVFNN